ncbi:xylose isomerase [Planococcus glaciei]|uniref:Sugar phosphate isomerase/epimerase n=1 Tax=Planococcus glaciei TaxID=459472 RepID=A0A7H8QD66_9BACL|nr:sugar phosphate isomerase/epimerase [Planococcus glaciei]ETP69779.1 xylose isomerase [Planococcus glaciei CHR43]KOF10500.1 xylose isomerase [Planococcus glaciei]QDY46853.1 sugar phosphate isomerase/epimerase [Planococcus glaciei]QKX51193.1 sugar phosphate isomerase/epimerase [Planococcus glaciei]
MKLGVFTVLFSEKSLEETLGYVSSKGIEAVELGTGGYPGNAHCNVDELLNDADKLQRFKQQISDHGLVISALSCHTNPLHPQKKFSEPADELLVKTMQLASELGVPVVNTFSGCPGDHEQALYPNWPVAAWPSDFQEILKWQWEEKLIPYWKEKNALAESLNVKIGLELHGGFSVHTPATMLRLREACGPAIGANLDPSHMWWQGIDPVEAIKILGRENAIHHFHAKDTIIDQQNMNRNGLTDMTDYSQMRDRAWYFRTVGFGHDQKTWADIISTLRLYDYDYVVSIEHEDGLMSVEEGFTKAVDNLMPLLLREPTAKMWWT